MPIIKTFIKSFYLFPKTKIFYFVHIPKCAGSSIENFFIKNNIQVSFLDTEFLSKADTWNRIAPQHIGGKDFDDLFTDNFFDDVFCFTRHPVKRFVSAFIFNKYIQKKISQEIDINHFIFSLKKEGIKINFLDNHFMPMNYFISTKYKTKIFKLEDGFKDFIDWFQKQSRQNLFDKQMAHSNTSLSIDPALIKMTDASIEMLHDIYHEDFIQFNYYKDAG